MTTARTANLLGAVTLGMTDALRAACFGALEHGGETAAALATIGLEPGLTNQRLSRILGLSHPGVVRLVDKLVAEGAVERRSHRDDARAVALHLTAAGQDCRARLLARRRHALVSVIERLSRREQAQLAALLEKILLELPRDEMHAHAICRLCEEQACKNCPVERAFAISAGASPG